MTTSGKAMMGSEVEGAAGTALDRRTGGRWAIDRRRVLAAGAGALTATARQPSAAGNRRRRQPAELGFALQAGDATRIAPLMADYEREFGVTVRLDAFPYQDLLQALEIDVARGEGAIDLVSMDDPWIPRFAGVDALLDLSTIIGAIDGGAEPDLLPQLLALGKGAGGGVVQAVPWIGNLQLFGWREDVLARLGLTRPETWDDVVAVAAAVGAPGDGDGVFGFGLRGGRGNAATTSFLPVLWGHGGELFDDRWEPQLETAEARAALASHLTLAKLTPSGVGAAGHNELGVEVVEGRVAQSADLWPDQLLVAFDPEQSRVAATLRVGAQPSQAGVMPSHLTGAWLLAVPSTSRQIRAAVDLLIWLTAPAQQRRLLFEASLPPTRFSVLDDPEAVARYPFLRALREAATTARPRPRTPIYAAVETICGDYLARAINGEIGSEEALTGANLELRALMVREGLLGG